MTTTAASRPSLTEMIAPGRTALVIVDVQVDFGAPDGLYGKFGCDLSRVEPAIDRMIELHNATNSGGRPCPAGTRGAEYYRVKPQPGDMEVVKHRYSTFTNTSMEFVLKARPGIDTLVICGLTTECCVDTAVRDAFVRDYHLFLPRDASTSYRRDMHDTTFDIFAQYFAIVTTTDEIARTWTPAR